MPSSHGEFTPQPGDPHIPAAVDIDAVAIGVDLQRLQRQVVDASRQDGEMAGGQDRNVTHDHVAAAFEGDRLVGGAGQVGRWRARFRRFAST